jgi:hypothetical protein
MLTVPVLDDVPVTVVGLNVTLVRMINGFTVTVVDTVDPPADAEIVSITGRLVVFDVFTLNGALVEPAGTFTVYICGVAPTKPSEIVTVVPPESAGASSVTVPVSSTPDVIGFEFTVI